MLPDGSGYEDDRKGFSRLFSRKGQSQSPGFFNGIYAKSIRDIAGTFSILSLLFLSFLNWNPSGL